MTLAELTTRTVMPPSNLEAVDIVQRIRRATIATREDAETMTNNLGTNKRLLKQIEDQRVALVKPLNDHVDMINANAKAAAAPLKEADAEGRGKLVAWHETEERRVKAEAAERVAAEQAALEAAEKAREAGAPDVADAIVQQVADSPDPGVMEKVTPIRTGFATAGTRHGWAFEVEDAAAVPREYLTLDESGIKAAIKRGVRSIPGLRIFETTTAVIR